LRKVIVQQLRYVRRNLGNIDKLLTTYEFSPLNRSDIKYLDTIRLIYVQQMEMYFGRTHRVTNKIVVMYQPYA
jgi:hypothetical protein